MKRIAIAAAVVALSAAGLVGTAGAANAGPGQDMKCFGTNYGQSSLKFSDVKGAAHPGGPYGLAQLMAAHGPNGAIPLCS